MPAASHPDPVPRSTGGSRTLREIAWLFLKLGTTSFGGPAVHIAMMEDEVVARRRWVSRERFLDLVGATNLIPGPNSTEMAIHIGHVRGGWPGLFAAGLAFIIPSTLIVTALAWAYVRYGALPATAGILYAVKPVVMAIVAQALWRLGRTALKSPGLVVLAVVAAAAAVAGIDEIGILAICGLAAAVVRSARRSRGTSGVAGLGVWATVPLAHAGASAAAAAGSVGLWPLFAFFTKVGAVLFGSGYVLLAFLQRGLVEERGWLTDAQLLDAVAIGQVTPGPLSTTATFVGYLLAGTPGAAVATAGIFLPAFVFVAISAPLVPRLRRSALASAVLDGVNVASLALMAVVSIQLAAAAVTDGVTLALAITSAVLLLRFGINSAWLVLGAAGVGVVVTM